MTQERYRDVRPGGLASQNRILGGGRGFGSASRNMPVQKPKDFKKTMIRLWGFFRSEHKLLVLMFSLVILSSGIGLVVPYLTGYAVNLIDAWSSRHAGPGILMVVLAAIILIYVANFVLTFLQGWFMADMSQNVVVKLRNQLFEKLQTLPLSFFDTQTHGEIMSRITNDIDNISTTISASTTQLMMLLITLVGSNVIMLVINPILALVAFFAVPLAVILTRMVTSRTQKLFKDQQATLGMLNGRIEENISGLYVVKAFSHEDKEIEKFGELNEALRKVATRANIWSGYLMPLMNVINNLDFALVAGVGGILAINGIVNVGEIASFLIYSKQFARPMNEIASIYNTLQTAVAGAERVFDIMDREGEAEDPPNAVPLSHPEGEVEFRNVTFCYKPGQPILKNVSFKVEKGSSIALVGRTGAGKTTIASLITRFYDVSEGEILIDGRDIREYTRNSLRNCFGIVLQDTYLFTGAIMENIRYGRLGATDIEVEEAAVKACADHFIRLLPEGYQSVLMESGSNLSQGQRQLLAIARAFLADAPILILDEATSSVDTRTEFQIQKAMLTLMDGRTSFIIAHRLSTIRDADTILVIDDGRIVERGNHETLIRLGGIYGSMYQSQLKKNEDDD